MAKKKYKIKPKQVRAKTEVGKTAPPAGKRRKKEPDFPFVKSNYILFGTGLLAIMLGFSFLAIGDITLSPILLVLGYCVVIPIAILYSRKTKSSEERPAEISGD